MNAQEINFATAQVILNIFHGNKTLHVYENPVSKIEELCEIAKKVIEQNSGKKLTPQALPFQIFKKVPQLFSSLEPILSQGEHKKIMNAQEINFATAQVILNIFHGNKMLHIYENPVSIIAELCETTKKVIEKNSKGELNSYGLPIELPFQIFQMDSQLFSSLGMDIYSTTVKNEWTKKKDPLLSQGDHKKMMDVIYEKYVEGTTDKDRLEYVSKELEELRESVTKDPRYDTSVDILNQNSNKFFIEKLYKLALSDPAELLDTIDNWSSYELEDFFDKVAAAENSGSKHVTSSYHDGGIDPVLEEFIQTEFIPSDKGSIKTLRDTFANFIFMNFEKVFELSHKKFTLNTYFQIKKIDNSYNGPFPPSLKYIRTIFMPWLLLFKTGSIRNEKMIYAQFNEDYKKVSKT